ncbi:MAG: glycosyl hydrolase family 25 [Bacteroidaceae bacterium]|nr:glycosyl hydrolase family 25 [Bacteroidaceae bacterium]
MTFSLRHTALCLFAIGWAALPATLQAQRNSKHGHDGMPAPVVASNPDVPSREAPHDRPTAYSQLISLAEPAVQKQTRGRINSSYVEGIDISHYQHHINWDLVAKEPISYVYIKATEGCNFIDERYATNIREARRVGLSVGSYHFYRPNVGWQQQLAHMVSIVKPEEQDLVPLIDIERRGTVSLEKFIADLRNFIEAVERHYGKKPLLYTGQNFYNNYLAGRFPEHQWMIARYNSSQQPSLCDGKDFIMWQYSDKGRISGIKGDVDRSRILGDFSLHELGM